MRLVAALALLFALTPAPARAQDEQTVDAWMTLALGLDSPLQAGLHRWLETERDFVSPAVPTGDWKDRFPPMVTPRIELAARVGRRMALGVSAQTFHGELRNARQSGAPPYADWEGRVEQRFTEYGLHASIWPPRWKGRYVGASLGVGRSTQSVDGIGLLTGDPNARTNVNGTWKSSTTTYSAYAGWQIRYRDNPGLDLRAGWSWRDFGLVGGGPWTSTSGPTRGPLTDFTGRPVATDYSGPFVTLGFVFRSMTPEE